MKENMKNKFLLINILMSCATLLEASDGDLAILEEASKGSFYTKELYLNRSYTSILEAEQTRIQEEHQSVHRSMDTEIEKEIQSIAEEDFLINREIVDSDELLGCLRLATLNRSRSYNVGNLKQHLPELFQIYSKHYQTLARRK